MLNVNDFPRSLLCYIGMEPHLGPTPFSTGSALAGRKELGTACLAAESICCQIDAALKVCGSTSPLWEMLACAFVGKAATCGEESKVIPKLRWH